MVFTKQPSIFDKIKPTFNGSITGLVSGSVLKFVDTKMFDLNALENDGVTTKYLLSVFPAKIHFNTGNLAGYEFDVHYYDHATHTFTLVKITDERGDVFPSESSTAFSLALVMNIRYWMLPCLKTLMLRC